MSDLGSRSGGRSARGGGLRKATRWLYGAGMVGVLAIAPGCRSLSYYLSNTTFTVGSTDGTVTWNQFDSNDGPDGSWSETVTEPSVTISGVQGANLTIVALEIRPIAISTQFGDVPGNFVTTGNDTPTPDGSVGNYCGCDILPVNVELTDSNPSNGNSSTGGAGSSTGQLNFKLSNIESDFDISTDSVPASPTSTISAPQLESGGQGTNGTFEFEVIPLWKNAFNQSNFTGAFDDGSGTTTLRPTVAAESNDVPSPRTLVTMDITYNLAGTGQGGAGGSISGGMH